MKDMRGEVLEERVFERKKASSSKGLKDNCPRLRFPEFVDDWKEKYIREIANVVGGGTPDTNRSEYWNGNIQWFTPSEIGRSKYVNLSKRTITEKGLKNSSAKLLKRNSILLSSRATVGECSITLQECTTNQGFQSLIPYNDIDNEFCYYLINTKKEELLRKSSGSTFLEISNTEVKNIRCNIPSFPEQKKIANFLTLIDKRIDKQKELINILKKYKKGVLYKVFSKISTYKKLSDISIYKTSSKTVTNFFKNDIGTYPVYDTSGIAMYTNKYDMEIDYVSIVKDGSAGRLQYCTAYSSFIGTLGALIAKDCSTYYLYIILQTVDFSKFITGSIIPHIYYRDYKNLILPFPDEIKRNQISNLFKQIDNNIENNNIIISNLTLYKQGLLQKMFI